MQDQERLAGVQALGVDETAFLRGNTHRHTTFVTGVVDVESRRLLDVTLGRSGTVLTQWIRAKPSRGGPRWRWRRWTRSAATPPPCPPPCRTRCGRAAARRAESTVNRHSAAVFGFYDFHARNGVVLAESLVAWRRVPRGSFKPFLHHVAKGRPIPTRPVKLKVPRRLPVTLSVEQVAVILAACSRLRDRFLFALLAETGIRVGQALGLRHSDFVSRRRELVIVPRGDNANGARAKTHTATTVPVSVPLVRLYSDYMHTEYGDLDSDYVFVNLFSEPVGRAMRYDAVAKLVARLRATTGIEFTPHVLRHTRATELIRAGVPIEIVSAMLTHRSVVTTADTYLHLGVDDVRAELVRAGVWSADAAAGAPVVR